MDLSYLINKEAHKLGRATDMLWLSIREPLITDLPYTDSKPQEKDVSSHAIHFQCPWRFIKDGRILLAAHDIYNPYDNSLVGDDDWNWDVFGREKAESSVFDVLSAELISEYFPLKIEDISFMDTHDMHIRFNKGICFDTFIASSTKQEYYRIIDHQKQEHTVVFEDE